MTNPVVHFEIGSRIPAELQRFYTEAFGWTIDANNPMNYGTVDTNGGRGINGGIGPTYEGAPNYVSIYVFSDDISATLQKAEKLGGKTLLPDSNVMPGLNVGMFADPEGHMIGLVHGQPQDGAQPGPSAGSGKPVTWFEIGGTDPKALHSFYADLFGWEIHADNPMNYGEVHATEGIGGGIGPSPVGAYVTWYVEEDDLKGMLERIESLGGKTLMEPTPMSGVTVAMFGDPEGNRIGLYHMNAQS